MRKRISEVVRRGIRSRFVKDAGVLASGVFIAQLIALAISPILTRLFKPENFGVFSLIMAAAMIVSIFATLRLEIIVPAVKSHASALRLLQAMLALTFLTSVVLFLIVALLPSLLLSFIAIPQQAVNVLWLLPLCVAALGLYAGIRAWCVRKGRFSAISKGQVVRALLAAGVWLSFGFSGGFLQPSLVLTAGQTAADFGFSATLFSSLKRREIRFLLRPRWHRIWSALRENTSMISALVTSQTIAAIYGRLPLIVIAAAFGIEKAGYYALAERIISAPFALLSNAIGDVYRKRAADAYRDGKPFYQLMKKTLATSLAVSVVPFAVGIALTPYLVPTVFGAEWTGASFTIMILLSGAFFSFNTTSLDKGAVIVGATHYIVYWHIYRFLIEAIGGYAAWKGWLSYEYYLTFTVLGRTVAYSVDLGVQTRFSQRIRVTPK